MSNTIEGDTSDHGSICGGNHLRNQLGVEGLEVRITPTAAADNDCVNVLRAVQIVDADGAPVTDQTQPRITRRGSGYKIL